jgi:hypothetical protein
MRNTDIEIPYTETNPAYEVSYYEHVEEEEAEGDTNQETMNQFQSAQPLLKLSTQE